MQTEKTVVSSRSYGWLKVFAVLGLICLWASGIFGNALDGFKDVAKSLKEFEHHTMPCHLNATNHQETSTSIETELVKRADNSSSSDTFSFPFTSRPNFSSLFTFQPSFGSSSSSSSSSTTTDQSITRESSSEQSQQTSQERSQERSQEPTKQTSDSQEAPSTTPTPTSKSATSSKETSESVTTFSSVDNGKTIVVTRTSVITNSSAPSSASSNDTNTDNNSSGGLSNTNKIVVGVVVGVGGSILMCIVGVLFYLKKRSNSQYDNGGWTFWRKNEKASSEDFLSGELGVRDRNINQGSNF